MSRFKAGDKILPVTDNPQSPYHHSKNASVRFLTREIVYVLPESYVWKYTMSEKLFDSDDGIDPLFKWWKKVEQ